jgi:DNA-binding NtrC family response regulator
LDQRVKQGAFRQDLYYRINVVHLWIPPLRERPEDMPALVEHILRRLSRRYGRHVPSVSPTAMGRLLDHPWPGNARELENVLERSFLFCKGDVIEDLLLSEQGPTGGGVDSLHGSMPWHSYSRELVRQAERSFLISALRRSGGDIAKAAESMEITRRALFMKLRRHSLRAADFKAPGPAGGGSA